MKTGASRETLLIDPCRNLSAIASPTITMRRSAKRRTMLSNTFCSSCKILITCLTNDHLHGLEQVLTNEIRLVLPRVALILPLASSVTTQHQRRMQSPISRKLDVAIAIPSHPTRRQIYLKLLH